MHYREVEIKEIIDPKFKEVLKSETKLNSQINII